MGDKLERLVVMVEVAAGVRVVPDEELVYSPLIACSNGLSCSDDPDYQLPRVVQEWRSS